jgi:hypothetical protein
MELVAAANSVGLARNKIFGTRTLNQWTPLVIESITRDGEKNVICAEYLDSETHETTSFECVSATPVLAIGDIVHAQGGQISYFDRERMSPVEFPRGGRIPPATKVNLNLQESSSEPSPPARRPNSLMPSPPKTSIVERHSKPMKPMEMRHFQNAHASMDRFCDSMAGLIKAYATQGTRKPADVSMRLNKEQRWTANGSQWTPRLARFLLAQIFSRKPNLQRNKSSGAGSPNFPSRSPGVR